MSDAETAATVIEPSGRWSFTGLRELWTEREVAVFLVWRNLKVRYRQTALGVAWAVLQPLALMATFAVVLGSLARVPSENGLPYALMVYAGLAPWSFFAQAVTASTGSLVDNVDLISKVYFPRLALPVATICTFIPDLVMSVVLLFAFMALYGVPLTLTALWLVPLVAWATLLALGVGVLLAATSARVRDVRHALPFLLQVVFFLSPVVYGVSLVPSQWRLVYFLNPVAGVVAAFRAALVGTPGPGGHVLVSITTTVLVAVAAWVAFNRTERRLADVL